jgi:tRNA (cmo5U34)-methyltransferase
MQQKSSVEEIRQRFDADVERFTNLETGQSATIDSPLCLELVAQAAAAATPNATHVLDVGCGAGKYVLRLLQSLPDLNATLIDLSLPMLERARERVMAATSGEVITLQGDIRELQWEKSTFDVIVAASVLHHLRGEEEWRTVFAQFFDILRPGGSVWIFDLVDSSIPAVQTLMWHRYGEYLANLKDEEYRDHVFSYIEKEDTQRPLMFQLDLLREVGFETVDVLHKNSAFAAFGAVKK